MFEDMRKFSDSKEIKILQLVFNYYSLGNMVSY